MRIQLDQFLLAAFGHAAIPATQFPASLQGIMILPRGFQQFIVGGRRSINSIQAVNTPAGAHLCKLMIEFSPEFRRTIFSRANLFFNLPQPISLVDQTLDRIAFLVELLIHLDAFGLTSKLSRLFVQLVASAAGFLKILFRRRELL